MEVAIVEGARFTKGHIGLAGLRAAWPATAARGEINYPDGLAIKHIELT